MNDLIKFQKCQKWFWVPAFRNDRTERVLGSCIFSKQKPNPVPNPQMDWYNITFEEYQLLNTWRNKLKQCICFKTKDTNTYDFNFTESCEKIPFIFKSV